MYWIVDKVSVDDVGWVVLDVDGRDTGGDRWGRDREQWASSDSAFQSEKRR